MNLNNSDAYNANSIYFADVAGSTGEGLRFPYDDAKSAWDTLTSAGGVLYYKPKGTLTEEKLSTASVVLHSGNYDDIIKDKYIDLSSEQAITGVKHIRAGDTESENVAFYKDDTVFNKIATFKSGLNVDGGAFANYTVVAATSGGKTVVNKEYVDGQIAEQKLAAASKKGVIESSDSLASSEDLPTGKAVADYIANQIAGKTSIAYVIDSSSSSGANKEFGYATSSATDSFDMSSYSSKSLSTVAGATVSCSGLKVGDIVYTTGADVKDWFLGAKTDSKLTFYQISADTAALSDYVTKDGSEMPGTLTLKNSTSALSVSGPATFSSGVTISGKGFNYSGIEEADTDSDRAIWFSDSSVAGKPVYDPDFKYNPISSTLSVGTVSEGGKALEDKYEAKGHAHAASLKDSAGNDVSSLSANTKYKLTAGGESVTFTTPKDENTTYKFMDAPDGVTGGYFYAKASTDRAYVAYTTAP